jgi:tetratricopeptide (TPR) repeat protein
MINCHKCGYNISIEKFCPQCGIKLKQNEAKNGRNNVYFPDSKSDLIVTVSKTDLNILDKKIIYRVEGTTIHLQVLGDTSNHDLRILQKLISVCVKLEPPSPLGRNLKEAYQVKSEEANTALQQIQTILNESMKIESKTGVEINAINVGNLLVSINELRLKEIILLGNEHYYKNEHVVAIKHYDRALEIEPDNVEAWTNKGVVFGNMGKYNEAIDCYDRSLEIEPKYALALYNKGSALGNMGKYNEAIECYDRALEIEPKYALAWNNKGVVIGSMRKYDEAIDCYDRALEIEPKYALALYNKGVALGKMKKYNEAIGCYYKVLEIEPDNVEAWTNKGTSLGNMGKYNEAIECYDRALEIEPKYALALYNKRLARTQLEKS